MSRRALVFVLLLSGLASAQSVSAPVWVDDSLTGNWAFGGDQTEPAAAATPSGTFVVWTDHRNSVNWSEVRGALVLPDGTWQPAGGVRLDEGPFSAFEPSIYCGATECLVAWATETGERARRFSLSPMAPLGPVLTLSSEWSGASSITPGPASAPNYRVFWAQTGQLFVADVGVVLSPVVQVSLPAHYGYGPSMATTGSVWRAVWEDDTGCVTATLNANLTVGSGPTTFDSSFCNLPQVVATPSGFEVMWVEELSQYDYAGPLRGKVFLFDGGVSSRVAFTAGPAKLEFGMTRLASSTAFMWTEFGVPATNHTGRWFDDGGFVLSDFADDTNDNDVAPALVPFDAGVRFFFSEAVAYDRDLYLHTYDFRDGGQTARAMPGTGAPWHLDPSVGARGSQWVAAWQGPIDAGASAVFAAQLSATGVPQSPPVRVAVGGEHALAPVWVPSALGSPGVAWVEHISTFTLDQPVWFTPVSDTLSTGAPVRLNVPACCTHAPFVVETPRWSWVLWVDFDTGVLLRGARLSPTGALLDPPGRRLLDTHIDYNATATLVPDAGLMWVVAYDNVMSGIGGQPLALDGTKVDAGWISWPWAYFPDHVAAASDGVDLLLVWNTAFTGVEAAFVDPHTGAPRTMMATTLTADLPYMNGGAIVPSAVFDGREYLVTVDRPQPDAGMGVDLVRFGAGFSNLRRSTLSSGAPDEANFELTVTSPGRVAVSGLRVDSRVDQARTFVQVAAAVPPGGFCVAAGECTGGTLCVGGCCGGCPVDAGVPDAGAPDAGAMDAGDVDAGVTDAGTVDAGEVDAGSDVDGGVDRRSYGVGCSGCGASGDSLLFILAMLFLRRLSSPSPCEAGRGLG